MDDIVAVTLFRHGLTEGNKRKAYMGWNDSPLSEEAVNQLSSYNLDSESYDLFISSDLKRCLKTMGLLFPDVDALTTLELREMHFGDFQGKTYNELKDHESYQQWINDFQAITPPNGESYEGFVSRIENGWQEVVQKVLKNQLKRPFIVTHGGVIKYLLSQYAPIEKNFWDWIIPHGSGYELQFNVEQLRRRGRCISLREVPLTVSENG